jgi:hypothetical protein
MGIIANARLCSTPSLVSASSSRIGKFRSGMGAPLLPGISGSRAFRFSGFRCIVKTWFPAFLLSAFCRRKEWVPNRHTSLPDVRITKPGFRVFLISCFPDTWQFPLTQIPQIKISFFSGPFGFLGSGISWFQGFLVPGFLGTG